MLFPGKEPAAQSAKVHLHLEEKAVSGTAEVDAKSGAEAETQVVAAIAADGAQGKDGLPVFDALVGGHGSETEHRFTVVVFDPSSPHALGPSDADGKDVDVGKRQTHQNRC